MKGLALAGILILSSLGIHDAFCEVDSMLPEEICDQVGTDECSELTEKKTFARYVDLNDDGAKELIFQYGTGSCGTHHYVFKLDNQMKWESIGSWCGCEGEGEFKVKKSQHHGYQDIWTCGVSGIYDGKEYVGRRQ
ncbi:MAG: hypothetical protein EA420_09060 [Candidatus Competibacteraceae bacterium]|nr:MAG: hypothetical protein EA420_09060 [Candidatus Competibacteraceae bacterium]